MSVLVPFGDVLSDELGSPRRARKLGSSPRSRVWRVELAAGAAVVKQIVEAPDADQRYARELAALRVAGRATPEIVPTVLGVDPGERVLVLERIEHRRPARDWVVGYAAALARLHATGRAEDVGPVPRWAGPTERDVDAFLGLARAFGVPVDGGVSAELDGLLARLAAAPGHALLHGDPCPGNDLHTVAGVRFIDFEQASIGNGLTELAYLRIGFPTCWCSTRPDDALLAKAEAAYAATWRAATGGEPAGDLADACAGWLLRGDALVERQFRGRDHLARIPIEDWTWGTATARQRLVHRLGVVAGQGEVTQFRQLCQRMRDAMLARWPTLRALPARRPG